MEATQDLTIGRIGAFLAESGLSVHEAGENALRVTDVDTGVTVAVVLEGDVVFFSVTLLSVKPSKMTAEVMRKMLDADNGISTSYFQLYHLHENEVSVTLNNFCKLQGLSEDDKDDMSSCVNFLLADVFSAHELIGDLNG